EVSRRGHQMPRQCKDALSCVVQCCTNFSASTKVIADEFEPMEVDWERSMFGEDIFPNPVGRSQHSW
ncbi:hypothetical protein AVEN_156159-1, partial [Araneus ventricosus]